MQLFPIAGRSSLRLTTAAAHVRTVGVRTSISQRLMTVTWYLHAESEHHSVCHDQYVAFYLLLDRRSQKMRFGKGKRKETGNSSEGRMPRSPRAQRAKKIGDAWNVSGLFCCWVPRVQRRTSEYLFVTIYPVLNGSSTIHITDRFFL